MERAPIQQEQNPDSYVPEGMPEWKVGMHVRWRISPECPYKCEGCGIDLHHHSEEGHEATIGAVSFSRPYCSKCGHWGNPSLGHGYFVEVLANGDGFWAAASELAPLSDEGRER